MNLSNDEINDREEGQGEPGGNKGGDNGINPSQITAWLWMRTQSSFGMWRSDSPASTIWIIGQ
jgi:hypothetical protein